VYATVPASVTALVLGVSLATPSATQVTPAAVAVDSDDSGGAVSGPRGPEAGVWVIAETLDLPTRFSKTVVTHDQGRYLVSDKGLWSTFATRAPFHTEGGKTNERRVVHVQLRPHPLAR
jgi:hypothetical protein